MTTLQRLLVSGMVCFSDSVGPLRGHPDSDHVDRGHKGHRNVLVRCEQPECEGEYDTGEHRSGNVRSQHQKLLASTRPKIL